MAIARRGYPRLATREFGIGLAALSMGLALSGCEAIGAPLFTFFGAYFPAWLLCGLLGIFAAVLARVIFIAIGIDAVMALRLLTYSSIGVICAVGSWQFLFGP